MLDVALHRALAVTVGVLWAAFISRFWWPAEARRELSRALGELSFSYFRSPVALLTEDGKVLFEYWVALYSFSGFEFIRPRVSSST